MPWLVVLGCYDVNNGTLLKWLMKSCSLNIEPVAAHGVSWPSGKAVGPVCCVLCVVCCVLCVVCCVLCVVCCVLCTLHVKENGLAPVFLDSRLEHPAGWICARYKSAELLFIIICMYLCWQHISISLRSFFRLRGKVSLRQPQCTPLLSLISAVVGRSIFFLLASHLTSSKCFITKSQR